MAMKSIRGPGKMIQSVLGSLFKKPATIRYPYEEFRMPANFRGRPGFASDRCIGCRMCIRDCPAQAITVTRIGDKRFECAIDLGRCVYCAQCADVCPKKVIEITTDFELAQLERGKLKIVFYGEPQAVGSCADASAEPQSAPGPQSPPAG